MIKKVINIIQKNKIIVLSLFLLFVIYKYGFLIVFFLFTPKNGALSNEEKRIFKELKISCRADDISREPKYNVTNPRDTATYRVIIYRINSSEIINQDSLKNEAVKLKKKIDNLKLHQNFINYEFIYHFKSGIDKRYKFTR